MKLDRDRVNTIAGLLSSMKMTPRQVQEVFRVMGHIFETDEANKGRLLWCLGVGTILMSALKIGDPDVYETLGRHGFKIAEGGAFFRKISQQHAAWWFTLCFTGGGLNSEEVQGKEGVDIYRDAGFISDDAGRYLNHLSEWSMGWGHSTNRRFEDIYSKIEQISSWN